VSLDEDGRVLVGLAARERQASHPQRTATAFKRYMGTQRRIRVGAQDYRPEELSALVLGSLKRDAEVLFGSAVESAIITVPAYFNDKQRKATRRAGELAGLRVERLINEPTAAALAYGIERRAEETRFLVFDLGGGTFDVSVIELFEGVVEVRASTGDNFLGGEDFNEILVAETFRVLGPQWGPVPADGDPVLRERVRYAAEVARRTLSTQPEAAISIVRDGKTYDYVLTAERFAALAEPLVERLREPVLRALRDSKIPLQELSEVILIGGATRMPLVRQAVTRMFGRFPATRINPDEAVALGAAVQAGLRARDAALKEVVLTDVCPYTLGIASAVPRDDGTLQSDVYVPIIERNTLIPASRAKVFYTVADGQTRIDVRVFQGEARRASDNVPLGSIECEVPPAKGGEVSVEVRFTYDVNGLLEVDTHVAASNARRNLVIFDRDGSEPEADLESRRAALAALKIHPRDLDANRAAIARAERWYEQTLGPERERIAQMLVAFDTILDRQDPIAANHARAELMAALDRLEGERFL
jgi:molecular chaperone HscC